VLLVDDVITTGAPWKNARGPCARRAAGVVVLVLGARRAGAEARPGRGRPFRTTIPAKGWTSPLEVEYKPFSSLEYFHVRDLETGGKQFRVEEAAHQGSEAFRPSGSEVVMDMVLLVAWAA
jgi:hypothetical protein